MTQTYSLMTSFNETYWNDVASTNVMLADKYWPTNSNIVLYHELSNVPNHMSSRVTWNDLYQTCSQLPAFKELWKDHPKANGKNNTSFRFKAIKFAHKTFAIWNEFKKTTSDWLIWLDCDATIVCEINLKYLKTLCPKDKMISYIGRQGKYSECGFLAFNMNHPLTNQFMTDWENLYLSGEFIKLKETHDSWTFDHIRLQWNNPDLFYNLNGHSLSDKNPFGNSLLKDYIIHTKGDNKNFQLQQVLTKKF
jgi:hypothetical protein